MIEWVFVVWLTAASGGMHGDVIGPFPTWVLCNQARTAKVEELTPVFPAGVELVVTACRSRER